MGARGENLLAVRLADMEDDGLRAMLDEVELEAKVLGRRGEGGARGQSRAGELGSYDRVTSCPPGFWRVKVQCEKYEATSSTV